MLIITMMMSAEYVLMEVENGCTIKSLFAHKTEIPKTKKPHIFNVHGIYLNPICNLLSLVYKLRF